MYQFIPTLHAHKRFRDRYGQGDMVLLAKRSRKAGVNLRKRIRTECPAEGTSIDCDYFVNDRDDPAWWLVFVCLKSFERDWIIKTMWVIANPGLPSASNQKESAA